jgi:DNA-binding transcriptional LysR family regulator
MHGGIRRGDRMENQAHPGFDPRCRRGRYADIDEGPRRFALEQGRQIQEFEEEIGAALFDRRGKRTTLTAAGDNLLEEAERLLAGLDAVCRTAKSISQKSQALNVGCVSFFLNTGLTPFLEELKGFRPDLKLELMVMSTEAQAKSILSGSIDVGRLGRQDIRGLRRLRNPARFGL